jgi:hypothetical protein
MPKKALQTVIEIVEEELDDLPTTRSLSEGIGILHLHLQSLQSELIEPEREQDADRLLQDLAKIAATAVTVAAVHILPEIQQGGAH